MCDIKNGYGHRLLVLRYFGNFGGGQVSTAAASSIRPGGRLAVCAELQNQLVYITFVKILSRF